MSPKNLEKGRSRSIQTSQLQNLLQFYTKFACFKQRKIEENKRRAWERMGRGRMEEREEQRRGEHSKICNKLYVW